MQCTLISITLLHSLFFLRSKRNNQITFGVTARCQLTWTTLVLVRRSANLAKSASGNQQRRQAPVPESTCTVAILLSLMKPGSSPYASFSDSSIILILPPIGRYSSFCKLAKVQGPCYRYGNIKACKSNNQPTDMSSY